MTNMLPDCHILYSVNTAARTCSVILQEYLSLLLRPHTNQQLSLDSSFWAHWLRYKSRTLLGTPRLFNIAWSHSPHANSNENRYLLSICLGLSTALSTFPLIMNNLLDVVDSIHPYLTYHRTKPQK